MFLEISININTFSKIINTLIHQLVLEKMILLKDENEQHNEIPKYQ